MPEQVSPAGEAGRTCLGRSCVLKMRIFEFEIAVASAALSRGSRSSVMNVNLTRHSRGTLKAFMRQNASRDTVVHSR